MKKNRILYSLLALALSMSSIIGLSSCGETKPTETTAETTTAAPETTAEEIKTPDRAINVAVLAGPTGMGAAKLITDSKDGKTELEYNVTVDTNPSGVAASVINGDYDIAALPTNLAASLYNKTSGKVLCAAVNTGGVLYVLENGDTIHSIEDLRGKTIYSTGQASTPEYVLNYILRKNGLEPGTDVTVEYLSEHSELAAKIISGEITLGVLPEPNVTTTLTKGPDGLRTALNLTSEWKTVAGDESSLLQGCVAVRADFAEEYPEVMEKFLEEYRASVEYITTADDAADIIADCGIVPSAAIAKKALPNCNIMYLAGDEMKPQLSGFLSVLFEADPTSVGGKLPADDFYYGAAK